MAASSSRPAARARAVKATIAAAEELARQMTEKKVGDWLYDASSGEWFNRVTGAVSKELPTTPTTLNQNETSDEDIRDRFTLSVEQIASGIRLAVSEKDGQIQRCPECGRRRLVHLRRDGNLYTICADAMGAKPTCTFHELTSQRPKR